MKRTFLIFGLIIATGVLFKTLVVANTVDQSITYPIENLRVGDATQVKLDASMVGLFMIEEQLFFRDVYGNVGIATEVNAERRMFSRAALPAQYEIAWENGMTSSYSTGPFVLDSEEFVFSMPALVEDGAVKVIKN